MSRTPTWTTSSTSSIRFLALRVRTVVSGTDTTARYPKPGSSGVTPRKSSLVSDEDTPKPQKARKSDVDDTPPKSAAKGGAKTFEFGQHVEAKFLDGVWYGAVVSGTKGDKFILKWDDGDSRDRCKEAREIRAGSICSARGANMERMLPLMMMW